MNKLKAKLKRQGGFTLIEMLIVVAIIAILIFISIPIVNGALEKARDATDQANERAAKAESLLYFMGTVDDDALTAISYTPGTELKDVYYDAQNGNLVKDGSKVVAYGQCTGGAKCYIPSGKTAAESHAGKIIQVTVTAQGVFSAEWVDKPTASP